MLSPNSTRFETPISTPCTRTREGEADAQYGSPRASVEDSPDPRHRPDDEGRLRHDPELLRFNATHVSQSGSQGPVPRHHPGQFNEGLPSEQADEGRAGNVRAWNGWG